jgi:hypothetical protein
LRSATGSVSSSVFMDGRSLLSPGRFEEVPADIDHETLVRTIRQPDLDEPERTLDDQRALPPSRTSTRVQASPAISCRQTDWDLLITLHPSRLNPLNQVQHPHPKFGSVPCVDNLVTP